MIPKYAWSNEEESAIDTHAAGLSSMKIGYELASTMER